MKINNKSFRPFIDKQELQCMVEQLASAVSKDYAEADLMVCPVLTGAYLFAADLTRQLTIPCRMQFVRYTSYSGMASTGTVSAVLPFTSEVTGRDVLIVEDVIDSGLTIQVMLQEIAKLQPRSVKVCALLYKPNSFRGNYSIDYVGREIGDEFIIGYGMDYDELGRNLPEIMVIDE